MNILAQAPQGLTRPLKKAVRALALVASISFGSLRSSAADQVSLEPYQWNKLNSDTGNIATHSLASREYLESIDSTSSSMLSRQVQIYNLLYQYFPTVQASLDSAVSSLSSIHSDLSGGITSSLNDISNSLSNLPDWVSTIRSDLHSVIVPGSLPSVRVSFDPRLAVTNKLELSDDIANALTNSSKNIGFNTNYNPRVYTSPTEKQTQYYTWLRSASVDNARNNRQIVGLTFPSLTGDFLSDSVAVLRFQTHVLSSVSLSGIRSVLLLDNVTNRLDSMQKELIVFHSANTNLLIGISNVLQTTYLDNLKFHSANTNLLTEIKTQDKDHYDSFEELKEAVLSWIDRQQSESAEAGRQADEVISQLEGYQPESGAAGDQSFASEDLTTKITSFDSLVNELAGRSCPQTLVIRFGGWSLFGAEVNDDPIVIPLSRVQSVIDFIRMGFGLLWYGLSLLVMWWLVRLVVSLQHKVITWTFTTTSGPQS